MRKTPPERQRELDLKDELESLIDQDIAELTITVEKAKKFLPARKHVPLDYHEVKNFADDKADDIVDAIAEFYLDKNIINEIPYVTQKNSVDKITVSNLLFQMKTAEHAIIKLLEQIDEGNLQPRSFEVLSSLQKSKMEIVKHLAQFMVIMESNYKNLKEDYRVKKAEAPEELGMGDVIQQERGTQFRGTKSLMDVIRQAIPETRASGMLKEEGGFEDGITG